MLAIDFRYLLTQLCVRRLRICRRATVARFGNVPLSIGAALGINAAMGFKDGLLP